MSRLAQVKPVIAETLFAQGGFSFSGKQFFKSPVIASVDETLL